MDNKTKFDDELLAYKDRLKKMDYDRLLVEKEKIDQKLVVPYLVKGRNGYEIENIDISADKRAKNRIYMRKMLGIATKWTNLVINNQKKIDSQNEEFALCGGEKVSYDEESYFAMRWADIEAMFASSTTLPDRQNKNIPTKSGVGMKQVLSLNGLVMYKKFLISFANNFLFNKKPFNESLRDAKYLEMSLNGGADKNLYFDKHILPENFDKYYRIEMKQKALDEALKLKKPIKLF